MPVLISFNVLQREEEIVSALFESGYTDHFLEAHNKKVYLPKHMFYHKKKNAGQALEELKAMCNKMRIRLDRCIAFPPGMEWKAIFGVPVDYGSAHNTKRV